MTVSAKRRAVLIVGGGFGGLKAAQSLRKADVDVTLIDRRNFHLFQPLLYQVATGELSPANIASPLRSILRKQKNVRVILGEVESVSLDPPTLHLTDRDSPFDYLILATGSTHHYFGNEQWAPNAPGLKTIENATEIRRTILGAFEAAERCDDPEEFQDILTFVIVGAGPTGAELTGALSEIANHTLRRDFRNIDPSSARIIVIDAAHAVLNAYPQSLSDHAAEDLRKLGARVLLNSHVADITPSEVIVAVGSDKNSDEWSDLGEIIDGTHLKIRTRNVIWAAGVRGESMGGKLCAAASIAPAPGGRVPVQPDCSLAGFPNVFVVGDLASLKQNDKPLPGLAPVAMQMGAHAASCILADLKNQPRSHFRYHDRGSMAVIGRYKAVGMIGDRPVKGFVAWFLWLSIHLMYIDMFRNRLLVLMQWAWTFLTHDRSARLITGGPDPLIASMDKTTGWDSDPAMPAYHEPEEVA